MPLDFLVCSEEWSWKKTKPTHTKKCIHSTKITAKLKKEVNYWTLSQMHIKYSKEDKKACQRERKCYTTSLRVLVKLKDLSEFLLKKRK